MRTFIHHAAAATLKLKAQAWLNGESLVWTGLAVLLLYGLGIGNHTLWGYHEPYVGGIVREMATSRDFVIPTLNGQPYLEKPPLFYAFAALVCRAFGTFQPWALRLPSALLAMATCAWVSFLGWRLGSPRAAGWAGFTLATSYLFFEVGQTAVVDMALAATVSFALGLAFLVLVEPCYRRRWLPWFWVALGATFMAKGVVGPAMVLAPLAVTFLVERDRRLYRAFLGWNWGLAAAVLMTASWVILLVSRGGSSFLNEVFLRNSLGRFIQDPNLVPRTGRLGEHVESWYFYLARVPANVLPWTAVWLAALGSAFPRRRGQHPDPRSYFLPLAFAINLLALSCSLAKREVYLLPALPVTFLHLALWLDQRLPRLRQHLDRTLLWSLGITLGAACLVAAGFPWVLVREAGLSRWLAAGFSLLALAMCAWSAHQLRWRRYPAAFRISMAQWTLFLALFLVFGVPAMDRRDWQPLEAPYRHALALERAGSTIVYAGLTETQMGFGSLTFGQTLPRLEDPGQLQAVLDQPGPVAVLVEPRWWDRAKALGARGAVVPTEADQLPARRRVRAPVLVINREPSRPAPPAAS